MWDDSGSRRVFLALRGCMESSRLSPAVVRRNLISSHRSRQNAFNCSVMTFHFLNPLFFANTYRSSNAARLFLNKTLPPSAGWKWRVWGETKNRGLLKKKTSGICLKLSQAYHALLCQMIGRLLCFYKHGGWGHGARRERGIFANWIMWGQRINGMNGI